MSCMSVAGGCASLRQGHGRVIRERLVTSTAYHSSGTTARPSDFCFGSVSQEVGLKICKPGSPGSRAKLLGNRSPPNLSLPEVDSASKGHQDACFFTIDASESLRLNRPLLFSSENLFYEASLPWLSRRISTLPSLAPVSHYPSLSSIA